MVVTFDRDERAPGQPGEPVPPGWHLAYFPEATYRRELGEAAAAGTRRAAEDAAAAPHVCRRDADLSRADPGGRVVRRETEFSDVQLRPGGAGTLILATQTRRIYTPRGLAVTEDGHSVFVKPFRRAHHPASREQAPQTRRGDARSRPTRSACFVIRL